MALTTTSWLDPIPDNSLGGLMTFTVEWMTVSRLRASAAMHVLFSTLTVSTIPRTAAMIDLELGDFDGDGKVDVAHCRSYLVRSGTSGPHDASILHFASGFGQGAFFVDFRKDARRYSSIRPRTTYLNDTHSLFKIEATATSVTSPLNGGDVLIGAVLDNGDIKRVQYLMRLTATPGGSVLATGGTRHHWTIY